MKLKEIITAMIFLLLMAGCTTGNINSIDNGNEVTLCLEPGPGNPRNSEGDFINLKDGRILFVYSYFTAGTGDNASAFLAGRYSSDGGKTWTQKDVTILPNEGKMNTMSVSLLRLKNGKIAMLYLRKDSEDLCEPYIRFSDDEAQTWSDPVRCVINDGYYVVNNDRLIQLGNGRLLFPSALHNHSEAYGKVYSFYSDDNGKTWHQSAMVPNPENVILQEPGTVELKDGKLLLFCRTPKGVQYFTYSEDNGETWSEIKPGNIKSPLSPASIKRIPSTGDLLLAWNNNYQKGRDGGRRTPYNVAISKDEGKTWEKIKTVESDPMGWYCYTAIDFTGNDVLLGHCAGDTRVNNGLSTTHITRLSLDWIYADAVPSPYVVSEKDGVITLGCKDENAEIRYTLDGSLPGKDKGVVYKKPFKVDHVRTLMMQALGPDKTPSAIVTANVGSGVWLKASKPDEKPASGLKYDYYETAVTTVSGIKGNPVSTGVVDKFEIGKARQKKNFAFVFNGYLNVPEDDVYTLYLNSNDGGVLFVDGFKMIDNDGAHGALEKKVKVSLKKGFHPVSLRYFQLGGGSYLKVSWSSSALQKQEIAEEYIFH
jgi:hypothetical protein